MNATMNRFRRHGFACFFAHCLFLLIADEVAAADLSMAPPESVGMSTARLQRLTDEMRALVDQKRISGVVTMVAKDDKVVYFEAVGQRDIASGAQMRKDSIFRIYSMTKPITGVAMMILYEEGKWQLNDPVSKYIPEFAHLTVAKFNRQTGTFEQVAPAHPMTMRELLSHTGGLTYGDLEPHAGAVDKMYNAAKLFDPNKPMQSMIDKLAKLPLLSEPGERWHYSISADIQGYLVEKLSGQPFPEFLEKRIFRPLKMTDTGFYVPPRKLDRFAEFYTYDSDRNLVLFPNVYPAPNWNFGAMPVLTLGGAGLVSTANDYMRFCQMLLNGGQLDGQRVLSPLTVRMMRSNVLPASARTISPGIGFGLNFAVVEEPMAGGEGLPNGYGFGSGYGGQGTYYWMGLAGTWFWIDPVYNLIVIGMIQQAGEDMPDMRALSKALVYQAIIE